MSIELPKFPQSIEQSDRNAAFAFSQSLSKIPGKTKEVSEIFASFLDSRYSAKA